MMLGGAAHDEEIAGVEAESVTRPASLWAQKKSAWPAEADNRDQWIDIGSSNSVGVPSNAVLACFVEVAEKATEFPVVVAR